MKKLISYLFYLIAIISYVIIIINIINFFEKLIILEKTQVIAGIRREVMLEPVVKLSQLSYISEENDGGMQSVESMIFATGFSISYNFETNTTIILTNDHFCESIDERSMLLVENFNTEVVFEAPDKANELIIKTRKDLDLCAIKIFGYVRPAVLSDMDYVPAPFEEIFIVGGPSGYFPIIVDTYLSALIERERIMMSEMNGTKNKFLLISEQVFPGHSGSPIYTRDGKVIGILFGALMSYGGIGASNKDIYFFLDTL